jgi:hypothetical protein
VLGVGVDSDDPGDLAFDPGRLERLAGGLGDGFSEVYRSAGEGQLPLSARRISGMSPAALTSTTLTAGTRLLACGASPES